MNGELEQGLSGMIQTWVAQQNEIESLRETAKNANTKQSETSNQIINEIKRMNISTLRIADGHLQLEQQRKTKSLTLRNLEEIMAEFFDDSERTQECIHYIKTQLQSDVEFEDVIRRYFD